MYQPFLVAPFQNAISKYLKPWLQPEDAMVDMQDCYVYRGQVQDRDGYTLFDDFPFAAGLSQAATADGVTTSFSGTLPLVGGSFPVGKKSIGITHTNGGALVINGTDNGAGTITGTNIAAGSTINYATGAWTINFTTAPSANTGIKITFGVKIASGNGTTGPYTINVPLTAPFAGSLHPKSLFLGASTATLQTSNSPFELVAPDKLTGDLTNLGGAPKVTAGTITYATGVISGLTFTNAVGGGDDIWLSWEYFNNSDSIKGIKYYWTANSTQDTLVFTNTQAARVDAANLKLTNISGPGYFNLGFTSKNFYSLANYQGKAFILNNLDPLTVWDGTTLFQPTVNLTAGGSTLVTGLHIFLYKNRLNILRPTSSSAGVLPQRDLFSALNNPFDWLTDSVGHGGFVDAPTPEWIIAAEFMRDELDVGFQDSNWKLRYTGIDTDPYRWQKVNDTRRVDAPYSAVSFQKFTTMAGTTGLLQATGVTVDRYDEKIIDFTFQEVNQNNFDIINGVRYDNANQQYLCYPSQNVQDVTQFCDKWLVWNFVEDNFAIWNIPSTCFGFYVASRDLAWQDFNAANNLDFSWNDFKDETWFSYFTQSNAKTLLFGTKDGKVMQVIPGFATDNGTRFGFQFTSIDFNPFIKQSQMCRFGFVDFYFDRPTEDDAVDENYQLSIDFYVNEEDTPYKTVVLNPSQDDWIHKRVFVNCTGNFHRFRVYLSDDQIANSTVAIKGFNLNGFILNMAPAGRIVR